MKPWKQSNSMKELLKKLRRHDTLVLGAGVLAATIMCGTFVYVTTPAISADAAQQEVRKDSLGVQKKASDQLTEINNYLEKLDQVVTGSQELVKEIQTIQNEQKEIAEKTKENNTNTHTDTKSENTKVVEKISGLDKELAELHNEIISCADQVRELKDSIEKGDAQEKDKEAFAQINNALLDIRKECEKSGTAVSGLIAQLKSDETNRTSETTTIINNLESIEREIQRTDTTETLTRMETELIATQTTYTTLLGAMEKNMENSISTVGKSVESGLSNVDKSVDKVSKKVETGFSNIDEKVGTGFSGMDEKVGSGFSSIDEKVGSGFSSIDEKVGSGFSGIDEKVGTGFSDINRKMDSGLSDIDGSINSVNQSVSSGFSSVESGVQSVRKAQENTDDKISSIDTKLNEVDGKVNNIGNDINSLKKRIEDFFKYMASAKKEMASTLVILGVNVNEDASFERIINGIKEVPAAIFKSEHVEYKVHHHVNANGAFPYEKCTFKGGCFTTPVQHGHNDLCFHEETVYQYMVLQTRSDPDFQRNDDRGYYCSYCMRFYATIEHTEESDDLAIAKARAHSQNTIRKVTKVVEGCNKTTSDIDYYVPNCGYREGSITEATIVYPKYSFPETALNVNDYRNTEPEAMSTGILTTEVVSYSEENNEPVEYSDDEPVAEEDDDAPATGGAAEEEEQSPEPEAAQSSESTSEEALEPEEAEIDADRNQKEPVAEEGQQDISPGTEGMPDQNDSNEGKEHEENPREPDKLPDAEADEGNPKLPAVTED